MIDINRFEVLSNESKPKTNEMVIFIARDVSVGKYAVKYDTDPYCGWLNSEGKAIRWPHNFSPTHFMRLN